MKQAGSELIPRSASKHYFPSSRGPTALPNPTSLCARHRPPQTGPALHTSQNPMVRAALLHWTHAPAELPVTAPQPSWLSPGPAPLQGSHPVALWPHPGSVHCHPTPPPTFPSWAPISASRSLALQGGLPLPILHPPLAEGPLLAFCGFSQNRGCSLTPWVFTGDKYKPSPW